MDNQFTTLSKNRETSLRGSNGNGFANFTQPQNAKKEPRIVRAWHNLPFITKRHYGGDVRKPNSEIEEHEEMFEDVLKRSRTVLFHAKTIFPFDLFPNDLIIDITKVTVVNRSFFLSGETQSIHIRDIMDVRVETGPFFSSLTMLDLGYIQRNKLHVNYLKKKDAVRARQIIEVLIAATKAGVDLTKIPRRDLISRLPELLQSQRIPLP